MWRHVLLVLAVGSCGGGGGLSSNAPLSTLTEDDLGQLCERLIASYEEHVDPENVCTFVIVWASTQQAEPMSPRECRLAALLCENQIDEVVMDVEQCQQRLEDQANDCAATVGETEACFEFGYEAIGNVVGSVTCDDVGDETVGDDILSLLQITETSPECEPLLDCVVDLTPF